MSHHKPHSRIVSRRSFLTTSALATTAIAGLAASPALASSRLSSNLGLSSSPWPMPDRPQPAPAPTPTPSPIQSGPGLLPETIVLSTSGIAGEESVFELTGPFDFAGQDFFFVIDAGNFNRIESLILQAYTDLGSYFRVDIVRDFRTFRAGGDKIVTTTKFNIRSTAGSPDWSSIERIELKVSGRGGENTVIFRHMSTIPEATTGVATVAFDDGWLSDYTVALPLMQNHGIRTGVSYVIPERVGEANRMSITQLQELQNVHGWDIGSHGSVPLTNFSLGQLATELANTKKYMVDNGISRGMNHFSYPLGRYNREVLEVVRTYFDTARTIEHDNETVQPGDPYRLRVFYVISSTTVQQVQNALARAVANKTWLIMVYHNLMDSSDGVPETVTTANFTEHMRLLSESGLPVQTIREVWENR
ncbi:polysaccharide deacetylase family protein [Corynebacterium cystitidis]|uniref:polysaccharide deacetylase family protein n=1 Tax=Corynebacterium cystitidis TaxID=35757 RepID=UPI00211DDCC8|nr:polysaccharide deacetylase family protein [Corynebacterium cystitidis]